MLDGPASPASTIEDLNFADTRHRPGNHRPRTARETVPQDRSRDPHRVFHNRLTAQMHRQGLRLYAVNPAYTSAWGEHHWRKPYENDTPARGGN